MLRSLVRSRSMFTRTPAFGIHCRTLRFSTQAASEKKMTADEVPHPHEFTDGDPMPHLREALSHGPRSINDSVAPELDQLSQDICSLNMVELVQVNYLLCKKLGIDPDILSIIKGALQSGGGGGESAAESTATKETGFRSISLREVPTGVKERFPIMKLMRAEDEKLSLADVRHTKQVYNFF